MHVNTMERWCVCNSHCKHIGLWSLTGGRATYTYMMMFPTKTEAKLHAVNEYDEMCGVIALYTGQVRHA